MSSLIKSNLNMLVVGFGCCKQEIFATQGSLYGIQRYGVNFVNAAEDADIMVIQGFFNEKGIKRILNIPEYIDVVAVTPLGYPDETPSSKTRKNITEIIHNEKF